MQEAPLYGLVAQINEPVSSVLEAVKRVVVVRIQTWREITQLLDRAFCVSSFSFFFGGACGGVFGGRFRAGNVPVATCVSHTHILHKHNITRVYLSSQVGVIGIACPKRNPLLGFVSLVGPAVVRGR